MSDYKCINPYYSNYLTKRIGYGELITSDRYNSLPPSERTNFQRKEDQSSPSSRNSSTSLSDSFWDSAINDIGSSSSPDYGSSSSSSDSGSSFDFGGGDTGGGGASGDW